MERAFAAADRRYLPVAEELHWRYGDGVPTDYWQSDVRLPLDALLSIPVAVAEYDLLVKAFPLMAQAYRRQEDEPRFTDADLRTAGWPEEDIVTVDRLLQIESGLTNGATRQSPTKWSYTVSPNLLEHLDAPDGRAYVRRRLREAAKWDRRARHAFGSRPWNRVHDFWAKPWGKLVLTVIGGLLVILIARWLNWT
jgi:hypothetical protein